MCDVIVIVIDYITYFNFVMLPLPPPTLLQREKKNKNKKITKLSNFKLHYGTLPLAVLTCAPAKAKMGQMTLRLL